MQPLDEQQPLAVCFTWHTASCPNNCRNCTHLRKQKMKTEKKQILLETFSTASFTPRQLMPSCLGGPATASRLLEDPHRSGPVAISMIGGEDDLEDTDTIPRPDLGQESTPHIPTILVVDDTPSIRESLAKFLRTEGYAVKVAASGDDALHQYDPERIDLVVLDLNLPGTNGWEVFRRLIEINPLQAILIITGQPLLHRGQFTDGSAVVMQKPLNIPRLLQTIETVLREPDPNRLLRIEIQRSFTRLTRPQQDRFSPMPLFRVGATGE